MSLEKWLIGACQQTLEKHYYAVTCELIQLSHSWGKGTV
jgi:hypothetical protein